MLQNNDTRTLENGPSIHNFTYFANKWIWPLNIFKSSGSHLPRHVRFPQCANTFNANSGQIIYAYELCFIITCGQLMLN